MTPHPKQLLSGVHETQHQKEVYVFFPLRYLHHVHPRKNKINQQRQPDTIPYYNVNVLCTTQIVASDVQPWMVIGDGIDNAVFRKISWGGKLFGQLQVALFPCSLINKRSSGRQSLMGISLRRRSWITLVFLLHSISRNDNSASRRLMIRTLISFAFQQRINICSGYSRTALLLGNQQILQKLP